ncbi:MAG: ComF family protein [Myxococcales bacterium]|nr:ComF family protein [Myxococcales bacterium]
MQPRAVDGSPWPLLAALEQARRSAPSGIVRRAARALSRSLATLAGAARCAACDCALSGAPSGFCEACVISSPPVLKQVGDLWVLAGARFEPTLRQAIHRLKYSGQAEAVEGLTEWWSRRLELALRSPLPHALAGASAAIPHENTEGRRRGLRLVPVPLHPNRLVERGFNQSALLATGLARRLDADVGHYLCRVKATEAQATLGQRERAQNIQGAFRSSRSRGDARVILVDDVATTGATLGAAVQALRAGGMSCIGAVVLAVSKD